MKSRKQRNILGSRIQFLLLALGILLHGCGSKTKDSRIIEFWAMGVEARHVRELLPQFEKENPGVHVKVQAIPWSAAHEKLLTAYAGNSTPDLCQLGNTWIPEFVVLDAIVPLNDFLKNSKVIQVENDFPGIWETNVINRYLYGIPWYVDTRLMFYRKDLVEAQGYTELPTDWAEFFRLCEKLVEQQKTEYAILLPLNGWHEIVVMALQNGSKLLRDNNCYGDFEDPVFQKALRFYMDFYAKRLCPLGMSEVANIYQSFSDNYYAFFITGPWNIGEFQRRLPESMQSDWATAPMPSFDPAKPGISTAGGSSIVMFKSAASKPDVWKLVEFLSREDIQAEFFHLSGDLPASVVAWDIAGLRDNPRTEAFYRQLQHVVPTPKIPEWEQIAQKIQQYVEYAVFGKMTLEEATLELNGEVNIILEKRRWLLSKKQL